MNQHDHSFFSSAVFVIAVCGFALLAALTLPLWSRSLIAWLEPLKAWVSPQTGTSLDRSPPSPTPAANWSDAEIEAALSECVHSLAPVTAELLPIAPIRSGDCGTPAPVLLRSIGSKEKVTVDPPLTFDCPMVVALYRWIEETVQPAAQEIFGSPVARIIGSSYACRTVYNLPNGHLSQHALANALDLPMFVLADGRKIDVTPGWGQTQRDLIAAAKTKKGLVRGDRSGWRLTSAEDRPRHRNCSDRGRQALDLSEA
jgi:hypothetical protein